MSDGRYFDLSNFYFKIFIQCILIIFFPISLPTQLHILPLSYSLYIYFDHISFILTYATPYSLSQKKKKAKQTLKNYKIKKYINNKTKACTYKTMESILFWPTVLGIEPTLEYVWYTQWPSIEEN